MLAQKIEPFAIDELGTTKYAVTTGVFMGCELLLNPDQLCPDQFADLADVGISREVSHKRCIALHR